MKELLLNLLKDYLKIFPNEIERQKDICAYLNNHESANIIDWNNFSGHIVAGGFIYAKKEKKFLVLHHRDLDMFLYPGGHIDISDANPLEAAIREVIEETGIKDIKEVILSNNKLIPIDIDTHTIPYNERLNLPSHKHFEFRYLFTIETVEIVQLDYDESSEYKWISMEELYNDKNFGTIAKKINSIINDIGEND